MDYYVLLETSNSRSVYAELPEIFEETYYQRPRGRLPEQNAPLKFQVPGLRQYYPFKETIDSYSLWRLWSKRLLGLLEYFSPVNIQAIPVVLTCRKGRILSSDYCLLNNQLYIQDVFNLSESIYTRWETGLDFKEKKKLVVDFDRAGGAPIFETLELPNRLFVSQEFLNLVYELIPKEMRDEWLLVDVRDPEQLYLV